MLWVLIGIASAQPAEPGGDLPLARPESPEETLYDRIVEVGDGKIEGRSRKRRDGEFVLWVLPDAGTVVRYERMAGAKVAEEHSFDAAGYPLATVFYDKGAPTKAVVAGVPAVEVPLTGWSVQKVPGGQMLLPSVPEERPGGGVRLDLLDGTLDLWIEPPTTPPTDPFADPFRDGVLAGCGCFVIDRATAWIDGRPGIRYRLLLPGSTPRDAVDLWAVSLGAQGVLLVSFKVHGPPDPVDALRPARLLLTTLDLK
jgi:hypothetical protein